jgi:hypothetical protein
MIQNWYQRYKNAWQPVPTAVGRAPAKKKADREMGVPGYVCARDSREPVAGRSVGGYVEVGELLLEMLDLGEVEGGDVGVVGMIRGVVLVVIFGAIEGF